MIDTSFIGLTPCTGSKIIFHEIYISLKISVTSDTEFKTFLREADKIASDRYANFFKKIKSHVQIGAPEVWKEKFYAEDPETLRATIQNLVAWASWPPGFVHPWR